MHFTVSLYRNMIFSITSCRKLLLLFQLLVYNIQLPVCILGLSYWVYLTQRLVVLLTPCLPPLCARLYLGWWPPGWRVALPSLCWVYRLLRRHHSLTIINMHTHFNMRKNTTWHDIGHSLNSTCDIRGDVKIH